MIRLYFGVPGCGKTTTAVRELYKMQNKWYINYYNNFARLFNDLIIDNLLSNFNINFHLKEIKYKNKNYNYFYSNYENNVSRLLSLKDLGLWTVPEYSFLSIDEASIEYNNRKFKSLPQHTIEWFKLHRHFSVDCSVFSQSWEDVDVVIRRIVDEIWYVKKLGPFTMLRKVYKRIEIDDTTHQIIDGYRFDKLWQSFLNMFLGIFTFKIYLRKPYYKYFDSWTKPKLPIKYWGDKID